MNFPLTLPPSLESQRTALEISIERGLQLAQDFACAHGWEHLMEEPFIDVAEITDSAERLLEIVHSLCDIPEGVQLPNTLSAGLEQKTFFSLSPQLYKETYPQGDEPQAYEKLVCHEVVHRLHVRILKGDEDAMGPVWFFEGFAVIGANQFANQEPDLPIDEMERIILCNERGSYENYGKVLRHLLKTTDIKTLVLKAVEEHFNEWVMEKLL